ncbi:hypothetical protein C0Q70_10437 [Pomacea canaliculata]|uniref:Parathyroid hormone/parathyroid hormone-related peptide receptor n=1 Tax=Pomacea canaliculata TaxID=400727 RepID=A0A2T7PCK9_POMCA|nr:hypothetical protein C0Q70_10437 [Pomacea canaliculata]
MKTKTRQHRDDLSFDLKTSTVKRGANILSGSSLRSAAQEEANDEILSPSSSSMSGVALGQIVGKQHKGTKEEEEKGRLCERGRGTAPFMGRLRCEVTWDNVLCWDLTPAGTIATQSCPGYINLFNKNATATRLCTASGTWWRNPDINGTWSNYTECLRPHIDLSYHTALGDRLRLLYTVGYSISMGTLLIAIIIMLCCRRLHCKSNTLHINLFLAFIMRAFVSFLKDLLFVGNVGFKKDVVVDADGLVRFISDGSRLQHVDPGRGLYLTMLVQSPLVTERKGVRVYVVMGVALYLYDPWVVVKAVLENRYCWNFQHNSGYYWIHRGPGVAVIVINLSLFINIFRKLFMKIRQSSELGASGRAKYRKLGKFILVLIPLFGIMYLVFYVVVPSSFENENNSHNIAYLYLEMTYNSFQVSSPRSPRISACTAILLLERRGKLKGDPTAFFRSYGASSCRKTASASIRSQSPPFASQTRIRTGSLSSQSSEKLSEHLFSASDKRGARGKRSQSFDLEQHPLKPVPEAHHGGQLLRQAIKTNAAQKAALRKQSTAESTSSGENSPLTISTSPTECETKFVFDRNRNSSSSTCL